MTSIARVRRKRSAEAVEALLFSKKCKSETPDKFEDDVKSLFIFAGTVSKENIPLSRHIKDVINKSPSIRRNFLKCHQVNIADKVRKEHHAASKASRYRLLGTYRNIKINELDKIEESDLEKDENLPQDFNELSDIISLYDIEQEDESVAKEITDMPITSPDIICNGIPMIRKQVDSTSFDISEYVYDLYYFNSPENQILQDMINIEPLKMDFVYDNFDDNPQSNDNDDDDSNDEDNWRNEYPEEDSYFDSTYDYYRDYEEEDFIDSVAGCSLNDHESDDDSVFLHGEAYSHFKKRIAKEMEET